MPAGRQEIRGAAVTMGNNPRGVECRPSGFTFNPSGVVTHLHPPRMKSGVIQIQSLRDFNGGGVSSFGKFKQTGWYRQEREGTGGGIKFTQQWEIAG